MKTTSRRLMYVLLGVLLNCLAFFDAKAALTVIGTHYKQDQMYPEFDCFWNGGNYPNPCPTNHPGATVHVYVKNTGGSSATITDATLGGYSMNTVIKKSTDTGINPNGQTSIYFYWDNPPTEIISNLGEPIWWKADPATVPAGGFADVAVRLRYPPTTNTINFVVVNSAGNVTTNVTKDAVAPRIQSISYSEDRTKVYLHWRRSGNGAPTSVYLDGTNVTSITTSVGDSTIGFASSVINLPSALAKFSYNVFQGIYADGKTATAGQRAWTNKFIYATYCKFADYDCDQWIDEAFSHGFNNIQMNLCSMCLGTAYTDQGFGYTVDTVGKLNTADPDMWFLNDEPDIEEWNQSVNHCGTGLRIPCDQDRYPGTIIKKYSVDYAATLRASRPNVPTCVNLDSAGQPYTYYQWGPSVDILQSDVYYEPRMKGAYEVNFNRIPLYAKAKLSYAVGRTACAGAEPNPSFHLLYSTEQTTWPYPTPESKRFEVYYTLAGGSKAIGYWWLENGNGMTSANTALWKEIGLCGNEIKTARDLIVRSTPIDMVIGTNSTWIWAKAVASGIDTLIVYVVNDDYFSDINGPHITNVPNAIITNTLPSWMTNGATPTAFEIARGGQPVDTTYSLSGNKLTVTLGTLSLTRMVIITKDANLKSTLTDRYNAIVKGNVCGFAPEVCLPTQQCLNNPGNEGGFSLTGGGYIANEWSEAEGAYGTNVVGYDETASSNVWAGAHSQRLRVYGPAGTAGGSYQRIAATVGSNYTATARVKAFDSSSQCYIGIDPNGGTSISSGSIVWSTVTTSTSFVQKSVSATASANVITIFYKVVTADGAKRNGYFDDATPACGTGPTITQQPSPQDECPGGTATFTVAATGTGTLTYQWQKNSVNLSNGGHYSGATTATLTVSSVDANDVANYRCVVTDSFGSATSFQAALTMNSPSLLNPSFELGNVGGVANNWTGYQRSPNPTTVWTIQTASPPAGTGTNYQQIANTTSTGGGGVRQDIKNCVIGNTYTIAGWFRGNSGLYSTCTVKVSPTASTSWATAINLSPAATMTGSAWTNFSGTVVATGTNMTIWLDGQTGGTGQNKAECFDGITVTCSP